MGCSETQNQTHKMKTIFVLGKIFSTPLAGDRGQNVAVVDADGTVRAQDYVSGTLTTVHALTPDQQEKIREAKPYSTIKL